MKDIIGIVLAAGQGTRMGSEEKKLPKVMFEIAGKPMIRYHLDNLKNAGVSDIVLVVGFEKEKIIDYLGDEVEYVEQFERLGTGHATSMAKEKVASKSKRVIVSYGDMPFYQPETIKALIEKVKTENPKMGMLTVNFDDPEFWGYGRIIRDDNGKIIKNVEQKDCTPEQLKIKESMPSFYIFNNDWLWANIFKIGRGNAQNEYYLPDLIEVAAKEDGLVTTQIDNEWEAFGINSPEQLKEAEEILKNKL
ncbi:MAG: NTP transferase domain-containing protein [Candidatus Berkelbacteria bacterium]|nr:NTP transferase domain-containing protein [Candidatus Berkelbacteria bacterium]